MYQQIEKYENSLVEEGINHRPSKPIKEFTKPTIYKLDEDIYIYITSSESVFRLNTDENQNWFARTLDKEEIQNLPFEIVYTGKVEEFVADEERAFNPRRQVPHQEGKNSFCINS